MVTPAKEDNPTGFLSPAFGKEAFRVDRSRPIVFVCGSRNSNGNVALRHQFLNEIDKLPRRIIPVLAEKSYPHQLIERNILKFEQFIASAANCVLIFVESAGSFAETGLFAGLSMIAKKTFVINTRAEATEESFLNLGPIKLIRKESNFDAVVDLDAKAVTSADATRIVDAILATYPKYENTLVFQPNKFKDLELRLQLACVHMAVTLLRAASASLVTSVLRNHLKAVDGEIVERYLSLLTSIGILQRSDELYFNPGAGTDPFNCDVLIHSASFSVHNVMAKALEWQATNNTQATVFLREQLKVDI
jgi:hypothetical protein